MWQPRADDDHCPQCAKRLDEPPLDSEEDEEPETGRGSRSTFEKVALVGNVVQLVPLVALLLFLVGGLLIALGRAVADRNGCAIAVFSAMLALFGGFLYAVIKSFIANTRK